MSTVTSKGDFFGFLVPIGSFKQDLHYLFNKEVCKVNGFWSYLGAQVAKNHLLT